MKTGTRFTLFAFALDCAGRLRGIANRREQEKNGSRTVRDRWLAVSWPNTGAGVRAAKAWACNSSVRAYRRRYQITHGLAVQG